MHKLFTLGACLLLGACAGTQQAHQPHSADADKAPLVTSTLEAIHNAEAIPLPVRTGQPSMAYGSSLSNYRVYALHLNKGERYRLGVSSPCQDSCLGIDKFALKPRALLLDANGAVIASQASAGVGRMNLGWDGEAPEDATYYLLVAADSDDIGKTIVIDDVWVNNSPLMAVETGLPNAPFGRIGTPTSPSLE
ncbi:hypothetical protein ACSX1C_09030 [Pseudomonas sp. MBLB4123]|uniref:hypothetical protein n=1 Tax=Pseudomonas sp. MBLB4123 TaxID=3451557 RepID=UPI003F756FC4